MVKIVVHVNMVKIIFVKIVKKLDHVIDLLNVLIYNNNNKFGIVVVVIMVLIVANVNMVKIINVKFVKKLDQVIKLVNVLIYNNYYNLNNNHNNKVNIQIIVRMVLL